MLRPPNAKGRHAVCRTTTEVAIQPESKRTSFLLTVWRVVWLELLPFVAKTEDFQPQFIIDLDCDYFSGPIEVCVLKDSVADVILGNIKDVRSLTVAPKVNVTTWAQSKRATTEVPAGPQEVLSKSLVDSSLIPEPVLVSTVTPPLFPEIDHLESLEMRLKHTKAICFYLPLCQCHFGLSLRSIIMLASFSTIDERTIEHYWFQYGYPHQRVVKAGGQSCFAFFVSKGTKPSKIHKQIAETYGEGAMSRSRVYQWCTWFGEGRTSLGDEPKSGRPKTSANEENTTRVDELIRCDRRMKIREIALKLEIPKSTVHEIVHDTLGYWKVSARWVPKMLTEDHKLQRVEISQRLLQRCQQDNGDEDTTHIGVGPSGDFQANNNLFDNLITGNETWVHLNTSETKHDSMTWKHPSSPVTKKFKLCEPFGDPMTGFCMKRDLTDMTGCSCEQVLPMVFRIKAIHKIESLLESFGRIQFVWPSSNGDIVENLDIKEVVGE
ncbi:histone-lysine N-methyltransferase SETMAR [Plakobranchus ocellatus]|uniref:Histone-lysine N-methyltransferase SETMAR n=1 Tax=Plakobranchus ocellatus TaxID=259542 RepID=A0AAV4BM66_9GAST|nr:histone-lysine N-methyltransferase SETMAR [Plakobranchus ocellatus]